MYTNLLSSVTFVRPFINNTTPGEKIKIVVGVIALAILFVGIAYTIIKNCCWNPRPVRLYQAPRGQDRRGDDRRAPR